MRNWRTTILGVAALLSAIGTALTALLDADPATVPDFGQLWQAVLGLGLITAADAKAVAKGEPQVLTMQPVK